MQEKLWQIVRENTIGKDTYIDTPYGRRRLTYADYTASGRGVEFIEEYLKEILKLYANTHTDDDTTGEVTTQRFHRAEVLIKKHLNAGEDYSIIEAGSGTTGGIQKLQQILGIYIPAATRERLEKCYEGTGQEAEFRRLSERFLEKRPVVFVGPYEHHSNEVSWRESLAELVTISLDKEGHLDLEDLEEKLKSPHYAGRMKIGSFSAASNVTGVKTPVYEVAKLLHRHGALAFFDYAAMAPYAEIDVHRDDEAYFDGCFFSPHKFLGGPGSAGLLIFRKEIYPLHLAPTFGAGGTVDFVNLETQDYVKDIEEREKPGTPAILQTMKAALALDLKAKLGVEEIERQEHEWVVKAMSRFSSNPNIDVLGDNDPNTRIGILSFNIRAEYGYLHPRFVVVLLNDLFGIQARGGCSCAGPYGHRLLRIDDVKSEKFRQAISSGKAGVKPGWARINLHYLIEEEDLEFILDAIEFVGTYGKYFLGDYRFDVYSGKWQAVDTEDPQIGFGIDEALQASGITTGGGEQAGTGNHSEGSSTEGMSAKERKKEYEKYLEEARKMAEERKKGYDTEKVESTDRNLVPFLYINRI